ncbi:MAG: 7-cyano-7-deazaguanine reductase [Deltaproteobacteria bacterium]|nr:MAG: 7-cyano-7-deazaguanine reductase [Deltaproteobacteria bacterium]
MSTLNEKNIKYNIKSPDIIKADVLDCIEYEFKSQRDIDIIIKQPEYTSLCPMSGLPDVGCITIKYRPNAKIVELKSLKYYLLQYRSVGIFYESLVNRILDDLVSVLEPKFMEITGNFTARGGITTAVSAVFQGKNNE